VPQSSVSNLLVNSKIDLTGLQTYQVCTTQNMSETANQPIRFEDYTILVIDDSTTNLGVVFEYLDNLGFELMVAQDGESGLSKAQYGRPDIILLDAVMPDLDGFVVCQQLKNDPVTRDIPVIFMTGLTKVEDKVRGFEVGAVDYVTKPIRKRELVARLVTHLSLRSLTQQLQQEVVERKRAEAALLEHQDRLEEMVAQRTSELTQANELLRSLTVRLAEVEETERQRLARELHDRVGQDLGLLDVHLNIIKQQLPPEVAAQFNGRFADIFTLISGIASHTYDVMAELRSPVLEDYGLVAALNWHGSQFQQRTGTEVVVVGDEEMPRPPQVVESALLRIAQEALTNVAKYAQADQVTIKVTAEDGWLHLSIGDDGVGFEANKWTIPAEDGRGWGLISMRERAEAINGRLHIHSQLGQGTQIIAEVPT
jgi:signal transduction histidine kinase